MNLPASHSLGFQDPTSEAQEMEELLSEQNGPKFGYWIGFAILAYVSTAAVAFLIWGIVSFFTSSPSERVMDPFTGFSKVVRQ